MPRAACLVLALTLVPCLGAGDAGALKEIEGVWLMNRLEVDGKDVPAERLEGTTLTIKGDSFIVNVKDKTITKCRIVVDAKKDPRHLDMIFLEGDKKDVVHKAIYKVDGDRLYVARGLNAEQERPNQFATWPDTGYFVVTWKRQP